MLIPGSNKDYSFILRPEGPGGGVGLFGQPRGGRQPSRSEAFRRLSQKSIDAEYRDAGILVNLDGRAAR